jgi:hypothetical protein
MEAETKAYVVKTGRVLHATARHENGEAVVDEKGKPVFDKRYYELGDVIELGAADAKNLTALGIVELQGLTSNGIALDAETIKASYVKGVLDLGSRHPATGAFVLMDKKTAENLYDLGVVSLPEIEVPPEIEASLEGADMPKLDAGGKKLTAETAEGAEKGQAGDKSAQKPDAKAPDAGADATKGDKAGK